MTVSRIRLGFIALVWLGLSACQQYALVPAQKPVEIGSAYSVTPISMWNVQGTGSTQSWTMDGPLLQRIIFSVDTDYGQPIIRISNQNADDSLPTFSEGSSPIELIE